MAPDTTNMSPEQAARMAGADNLLLSCAGLRKGQSVLFVNEKGPGVAPDVIAFLEARARDLGAELHSVWPERAASPEAIPEALMKDIERANVTIFNHQIGPLLRLRPVPGNGVRVLNYATTWKLLESEFARVPYKLWLEVMGRLSTRLDGARTWRVRCAHGTDIAGEMPPPAKSAGAGTGTGFSLRTFPMDTHKPVPLGNASGKIAFKWFATSAAHDLGTEGVTLANHVLAEIKDGRIAGFQGPEADVKAAREFLSAIGGKFDKDPFRINSWHAGVNPQAFVTFGPNESLEQWMLLAHCHPRILHFHVVGEEVPGELSATLVDATVFYDGEKLWDAGRLTALDDTAYRDIVRRWPGAEHAFAITDGVGI